MQTRLEDDDEEKEEGTDEEEEEEAEEVEEEDDTALPLPMESDTTLENSDATLPASPECITETIEIISDTIDEAFSSSTFFDKIGPACFCSTDGLPPGIPVVPCSGSSTSSGYSTSSATTASASSASVAPSGASAEVSKTPVEVPEPPKTPVKVPEPPKESEPPISPPLLAQASVSAPPPTEASTSTAAAVIALEEAIEDLLKPPETPEKDSSVGEYRFFCDCICCEERRYRRNVRKDRFMAAKHLPKAKLYFDNLRAKCRLETAHEGKPALRTWEEEEEANSKMVPEEEAEEGAEKTEGFLDEAVGGRARESKPLVLARPPGYHLRRQRLKSDCNCEDCVTTPSPSQLLTAANWKKRVLQYRLRCNCFSCCLWRGCRAIGIVEKTQLPCRFIQTELYNLRANDQMQHYLFGICN